MKLEATLIGHPGACATPSPLAPGSQAPWLPNPTLTPGSIVLVPFSELDQNAYAQQAREVSQKAKEKVYRRYGIPPRERSRFDIDHLIPLSLGGSNDLRNLWPHPWDSEWSPRRKAALEARLRSLVRRGMVELGQAQQSLARDWVEAYGKWMGEG